ncbi:MAG TPA: toll/interleukin-1 receptor domain-containing protein [Longimicrobium sp.]|nr:toll/interleukin-1 receptor domain-containing protein [Longimicrobium sp.]
MPAAKLDPYFWSSLLDLMEEGRVVPVVGPDAVVVRKGRVRRPLTQLLAPEVERHLGLTRGKKPATDLNDVACRFLEQEGSQNFPRIYRAVKQELDRLGVLDSEPLRKLARIDAFKLFVTTTFDDLLYQAVCAEYTDVVEEPDRFVYSPEDPQDLPAPLSSFSGPVVYHLFGRVSATPAFAVTEEDTLEFMHSLQSSERRPKQLLQEVKPCSLLILGSRYSDWLVRFFLRVAKDERLLKATSRPEVVAENSPEAAVGLSGFLRHYSAETVIYPGTTLQFIDDLSNQWAEHRKSRPRLEERKKGESSVVEHAIFISYANENAAEALALAQALEQARLPVWLDRKRLKGGDEFDPVIEQQIPKSSIFVPLLTPTVLSSRRRYYRAEWTIAEKEAQLASRALPFVVPVRIGDVPPSDEDIHAFIRRIHWISVPEEGEDRFADVVSRLKELFRDYQDAMDDKA